MTEQEIIAMQERIKQLEAQVARKAPSGHLKVSEKGGVSFYGLGRFPVTLYMEQWKSLAEKMPDVLSFIEAHKAELKAKPVKSDAASASA